MDKHENPHPLEGKLEPECREVPTPMECAALSIAISAKRIADALAGPDAGQAISTNIYHAISNALIEDLQRRG
jgi:hypothetical protein